MLPQLRLLADEFRDELVVIGVHAGKYPNERRQPQLEHACRRLGIAHPVLNDRKYRTWRSYAVPGWPTLVLLDPRGRILLSRPGETTAEPWFPLLRELIARYDAGGALDRRHLGSETPAVPAPAGLCYPEKLLADGDRLFIADTGRHRVLLTTIEGRIVHVKMIIGNGMKGRDDGPADRASFSHPRGLAILGRALYIADTGNHLLRAVDLDTLEVTTLAGTGARARPPYRGGRGRDVALASPWDLAPHGSQLVIAMAGSHQLWRCDPATTELAPLAGDGHEALADGSAAKALLAQPCGVASDGTNIYFVDSEAQAVRRLGADGEVNTLVGTGLFDYGDHDGIGDEALLQHPQAIAYHEGRLFVADTYNHKLKIIDPASRECRSWLGARRIPGHIDGEAHEAAFFEPSGLAFANGMLYIADTNNHAIRAADLRSGEVLTLEVRGLAG